MSHILPLRAGEHVRPAGVLRPPMAASSPVPALDATANRRTLKRRRGSWQTAGARAAWARLFSGMSQ